MITEDLRACLDAGQLPEFTHNTPGEFWAEAPLPIKHKFFRKFLGASQKSDISVFIELAALCQYSQIRMRVDSDGNLVKTSNGNAIAEIVRHGNITRTRSYAEIAKAAGVNPIPRERQSKDGRDWV